MKITSSVIGTESQIAVNSNVAFQEKVWAPFDPAPDAKREKPLGTRYNSARVVHVSQGVDGQNIYTLLVTDSRGHDPVTKGLCVRKKFSSLKFGKVIEQVAGPVVEKQDDNNDVPF